MFFVGFVLNLIHVSVTAAKNRKGMPGNTYYMNNVKRGRAAERAEWAWGKTFTCAKPA